MDYSIEKQAGVVIVSILGSLDIETSPQMAQIISRQVSSGEMRLVVDLSEVDYSSSAGLRALLGAVKEVRRNGGDLRLCGANRNVKKVLELSGFTSIVKYYETTGDAVRSFAS